MNGKNANCKHKAFELRELMRLLVEKMCLTFLLAGCCQTSWIGAADCQSVIRQGNDLQELRCEQFWRVRCLYKLPNS